MGTRPAIQVVPKQTDTTHRKHQGWSPFRVTRRSQIKLTHSDERGCRIPGVLASLGQCHPQRVEAHATEAQRAHVEALDVEVVALAGRGIVADLLPDALADLV